MKTRLSDRLYSFAELLQLTAGVCFALVIVATFILSVANIVRAVWRF